MKFYQCRFVEVADWNPRKTIGWIPERGAILNAIVELPEFNGRFRVTSVSKVGLTEADLREKQNRDRKFGGSIR